jgi:putative tryptophan/tyrosine transport system substrate-binding protein
MKRRDFIAGFAGAAAWPLVTRAQQPGTPVIGFLASSSPDVYRNNYLRAYRQGLSETGYVEGQNVAIEYSWAYNQYDRLPALAAELVRRRVAVIVANGVYPARAAKAATATIPIVFQLGIDPVAIGLVASLNRPGGNVTGSTNITVSLAAKRLELVRQLLPAVSDIAVLVNPANRFATEAQSRDLQEAAQTLGLQLRFLNASTANELDTAFGTLVHERVGTLLLTDEPFFNTRVDQIVALAAQHAVPVIYTFREFTMAGGLISYASNISDSYRQIGIYTGRILKGEKPADLPVLQPTKFELIVNLKTAKALGLTIPETLLATADEVIE